MLGWQMGLKQDLHLRVGSERGLARYPEVSMKQSSLAKRLAKRIARGTKGLLLFAVVAGLAPIACAVPAGLVKRVNGNVIVERAAQSLPVALGFVVQPGDVVVTASSSSVGLVLKDNSCVGVGPNSRYKVEKFSFDPKTHAGAFASSLSKGSLSMISGKLAKQSPDAVTVRTPATMLGVRGTEFVVAVP